MTNITYKITDGYLPSGLSLNESTGLLTGDVSFENVNDFPAWNSPASGSIGDFEAFETIPPISFTAETPVGEGVLMYSLTSTSMIPWGLFLDSKTGEMSGTILEIGGYAEIENLLKTPPVWSNGQGAVATVDLNEPVDVVLSATSSFDNATISSYTLEKGGLPWGMSLDYTTGRITGSITSLPSPGNYAEEFPTLPIPTWNTPGGRIIDDREFAEIDFTISASANGGKTLARYSLIAGVLPWGIFLDPKTGRITGRFVELSIPTDPPFLEPAKDPMIDVPSQTLIGSYNRGSTVNYQFPYTVFTGRSLKVFEIVKGGIPFGLSLSKTGQISGTIKNDPEVNPTGEYVFTVKIIDSSLSSSISIFKIAIQ